MLLTMISLHYESLSNHRGAFRSSRQLVWLLCLLFGNCCCRKDEGNSKNREDHRIAETSTAPGQLRVPGYEDRINEEWTTNIQGVLTVRYDLGDTYPCLEFIKAIDKHIADQGLKKLTVTLADPKLIAPILDDWFEIAPGQVVDRCFERWWCKDGQVINLLLSRRKQPGTAQHLMVEANLARYDTDAVSRLFPNYSTEK